MQFKYLGLICWVLWTGSYLSAQSFHANSFQLDGGGDGRSELAGDVYLLPYWMGLYLKVIMQVSE